jgi:hypothetical protein
MPFIPRLKSLGFSGIFDKGISSTKLDKTLTRIIISIGLVVDWDLRKSGKAPSIQESHVKSQRSYEEHREIGNIFFIDANAAFCLRERRQSAAGFKPRLDLGIWKQYLRSGWCLWNEGHSCPIEHPRGKVESRILARFQRQLLAFRRREPGFGWLIGPP